MTLIRNGRRANLESLLAALALAAASAANAGPVGPLTTFSAGTPAKATEVNGNFTTIVTTVNANDTRLTTVETTKQNLVTGTCTAGSAIRAIAANGTVTCQSTGGSVGFVSVPSIVGVPRFSTTGTSQGNVNGVIGRFQSTGSFDFLVAPISIPHGSTITAFSFSCIRNNGAACSGFLFRDDGTQLAAASIAAQATTVQTATTTTISSPLVDDQNFGYWVYMSIDVTAGVTLMPVRATVTYTLP